MNSKILLLLPLFLALLGCTTPQPEAAKPAHSPAAPVAVTSLLAAPQAWPARYEASGTVRSRTTTAISSRLLASILSMPVRAGDTVSQGQVLVTLDARQAELDTRRAAASRDELNSSIPEAQSAIQAARAALALATSTAQRMRLLFDKKSISPQEMDESNARLQAAQSALDIATARRAQIDAKLAQIEVESRAADLQRSYTTLRAPFAGRITEKFAEAGAMANPGAPLLMLERTDAFQLELAVAESLLPAIQRGTPVRVNLDAISLSLDAVVSEIVPSLDTASRSFTVKVNLPQNPSLRSGLFGHGVFSGPATNILAVPMAALQTQGQIQSLFVIEDGHAKLRIVSTGQQRDPWIEVLSGLSAGELVITPFPTGLTEGSPVTAKPVNQSVEAKQ
jgi:RND family efflux transporter MFP subunit